MYAYLIDGRVMQAEAVMQHYVNGTMMMAWGEGDPAWEGLTTEEFNTNHKIPVTANALISEVGRRLPTEVSYVLPDPTGDIVAPLGRYRRVTTPTRYMMCDFKYDYADAPTATIRESMLYVGCVPIVGLPAGQKYFTPAQIETSGRPVSAARYNPGKPRSPVNRENIVYILIF